MKAKVFILSTEFIRENARILLDKTELNGKTQVTFSDTGNRSARQNSLLWMWHTEVAESGKGSYDTKEAVHRSVKQRWVIPILLRDDSILAELYGIWRDLYKLDSDRVTWFIDSQISTATLTTSQMAEVLTDYQRFYTGHGVELTDPELKLLER